MSVRKLVVILTAVFCAMLALTLVIGWVLYKKVIAPLRAAQELPVELREARVIIGSDLLSRNQFIKAEEIKTLEELRDPAKVKRSFDSVQDIAVGELDGHPGLDIGLAGGFGAVIVDREGKIREQIAYEFGREDVQLGPFKTSTEKARLGVMQIIDIEGDGICEYLGRGDIHGAAVFDHVGKLLWSGGAFRKDKPYIEDMAVGDVDGDGVAEFLASWDGLELLDRYGKRKWQQPEEFIGGVEIVDTDGDGKVEIFSRSGSNFTVRDAQGQVVRTWDSRVYYTSFSLCPSPDGEVEPRILTVEGGSIWLLGFDGGTVLKFDAPLSSLKKPTPEEVDLPGMSEPFVIDTVDVYRAEGVWVNLFKDRPPYLAVITKFAVLNRSVFYVYDIDRNLVYHEVLPEECSSIAILSPEDEKNAPSLLVGGQETVWQYAAR